MHVRVIEDYVDSLYAIGEEDLIGAFTRVTPHTKVRDACLGRNGTLDLRAHRSYQHYSKHQCHDSGYHCFSFHFHF